MAGSLNLADTLAGAYTGFKQGAFNDNNQWVPGLAAAQQGLFDDNSPMNDSAGYNYVEPGIPDIFKPATSSANLPYNSDLPMENTTVYGPQNFNSGLDPFNQPSNYYSPYDWNSGADPFNQEENYTYTTTSAPNNSPNPGGGGGGGGSAAVYTPSVPEVMLSQDLSQRPLSGTVYAPDLSAYNDSSLFNYTGPGGVDGYTYGQGLRTDGADYSIFGSPTDVANPYYEGQFAPEPVGPADGAINMNPVQLPDGLPQIEVSADVSMPAFNGITPRPPNSAGDLTYQQTIDEMGIFGPNNPPPSTMFPSPNDSEPSLFLTPEQQAILADQDRMQQGQIGSMPYAPAMDDTADVELGMQGPPPAPPRPTVQQYMDMAQDMADQMAINLTPEELRDGLFIEPQFRVDENGQLIGKMGIPDAFLQDKTPIPSEYSLFMDEAQFDPDDMFAEPSAEELPLWIGKDDMYYPIYDDMGLGEPFIPTDNLEPASDPLVQIYDDIAKFENKTRAEEQYKDVISVTGDFMQARENAIQKQVNEARAEIQDAARRPVYTPRPAPTPAPRPVAPSGGYSTGSLNNSFSTRRDVRNLFA